MEQITRQAQLFVAKRNKKGQFNKFVSMEEYQRGLPFQNGISPTLKVLGDYYWACYAENTPLRTKTAKQLLVDAGIYETLNVLDEAWIRRIYMGGWLRRLKNRGSELWLEIDEPAPVEPFAYKTWTYPVMRKGQRVKAVGFKIVPRRPKK